MNVHVEIQGGAVYSARAVQTHCGKSVPGFHVFFFCCIFSIFGQLTQINCGQVGFVLKSVDPDVNLEEIFKLGNLVKGDAFEFLEIVGNSFVGCPQSEQPLCFLKHVLSASFVISQTPEEAQFVSDDTSIEFSK